MKNLITVAGVFLLLIMIIGFRHKAFVDAAKPTPIIGKAKAGFDDITFSHTGMVRVLRKSDWKLVYDRQGNWQLYHLTTDPEEHNNLFDNPKFLKKQDELLKDLMTWVMRVQNRLPAEQPTPSRQYGFMPDPYNYLAPLN